MPDISFAIGVWGNYWDKFGAEFVAALEAMDPRPAEVVIVTDRSILLPPWMRHVWPKSKTPMWDWFNEAVEACHTEWIYCAGLDDLWLPDGLADLDLQGDAVQFAGLHEGNPWLPEQENYKRLMEYHGNPMGGGTFFKRDLFLKYPWRRSVAADWLQWVDLSAAGIDVRFDLRPRFNHRRHADAHSRGIHCAESEWHVRRLKHLVSNRGAKPGAEWPPEPAGPLKMEPRLELGGGEDYFRPGWLNVDLVEEADIRHNLDVMPWPFEDNSIEEVYSSHCIEHLENPHAVQQEIARICKRGAKVELRTPHPNSHLAMTHSHKSVISPLQIVNTDTFFNDRFWTGPKRLLLQKIELHPTILLDIAKEHQYVSKMTDHDIMCFVPGTCHESRFFFVVDRNDRAGLNHKQKRERALKLLRGEFIERWC